MAKIINTSAKVNVNETKSFALLRTNPKLTSNVKLVVDSNEDIYLSSIKVSRTLSQSEFQKYPISDSGQYCRDLSNFYGKLSKDERYRVGREFTDLAISSDYSTQYENIYNYGASFNFTKVYDEQYRMFAPIWLEDRVPEKFVIYRVKDVDFKENISEGVNGQNDRIREMLSKATLIKSFDLTNQSKLGRYLDSHINDPLFPSSHIKFNFELDDPTIFSGIDLMIGGFIEKEDFIDDDYIKEDLPEILANNTLTTSFERNGIVSHNIFNLEFLFDDPAANNYDVYRYFGLYVDEHYESEVSVVSTNSKGYLKIDSGEDTSMLPTVEDIYQPILGWVKDVNGKYHNILNRFWKTKLDSNEILTSYVGDSSIFCSKVKNDFNAPIISKEPFNGFIELALAQAPSHNDKVFLGDLLEIEIENFNLGDFILIADETLPIGTYSENKYSCQGNTSQIAAALSAAIRNAEVIPYNATSIKNRVIVDDYSQGRNKYTTVFGINSSNPYSFIELTGFLDATYIFEKKYGEFIGQGGIVSGGLELGDYNVYTMIGGCSVNQGVLVSETEVGNLKVGDYVKENNKEIYIKIIEIVKDPYSENFRVIFEKPIKSLTNKDLITYRDYKTSFGKFSAFDFKDFNFDFYDKSNSNMDSLNLERRQYKDNESSFSVSSAYAVSVLEPGQGGASTFAGDDWALLISGGDFREFIKKGDFLKDASGTGYVKINEVIWAESYNVTRLSLNGEPSSTYEISNGQMQEDSVIVFKPGDDRFDSFGFKTLQGIVDEDLVEADSINIDIESEYDRLKENNLKETSLNSRIIPTICKFSLKDSTNSRNLPYILNVNEAFGVNNLSADISTFSERTPDKMNMEHFYIWNIPNYLLNENSIPLLTDYIDAGNEPLNKTYEYLSNILKDVNFDYFSTLLNYTGAIDENEKWINATPKKMYTTFSGGDSINFSSSVFKGLRYVYKDRSEFELSEPILFNASSDVNGYKIATIMCYTNEQSASEVTFEVIKNEKFRNITILMNVSVPDNDEKFLDRYLLYTLEDLKKNNVITNPDVRGFLEFGAAWASITDDNPELLLSASVQSVGDDASKFTQDVFKIDEQYSYLIFEHPVLPGEYAMQVASVVDDNNLIVKGLPAKWIEEIDSNGQGTGLFYADTDQELTPSQASVITNDTPLKYYQGGKKGWNNILQDVAAFGFAERINSHNNVEYVTVTETGEITRNTYCLEIQDGVEFIKTSILSADIDDDKPKAFKLGNKTIGYDLVSREDGGYYTTLKRMNGEYDPLFRDVVTFTHPYGEYKLIEDDFDEQEPVYNRLVGVNCMFASNLKTETNYGIIENFFFHKVNEEGGDVLKLSQETDKLPLYPTIGEIAIDKKDLNLFKSKYSSDYYTRSYGAFSKIDVHGTLSPIEERSFFASTVMKVKDEYDITSYDTISVNSLSELDVIRYDEKENEAAYIFEDSQKIYLDFYIADSAIKELKEEKITAHYSKYASSQFSYGDKTSLEDDTTVYIVENILPRFIVDEIKVYGKEIAGGNSELESISNAKDIMSGGYIPMTNFEIRSFAEKPLNFRLIYNKKPGYSYKLRVHSKIIA